MLVGEELGLAAEPPPRARDRRAPARHRQALRPRRDPQEAGRARRGRVRGHQEAPRVGRTSCSASSAASPTASAGSCSTTTSGSTATATRTAARPRARPRDAHPHGLRRLRRAALRRASTATRGRTTRRSACCTSRRGSAFDASCVAALERVLARDASLASASPSNLTACPIRASCEPSPSRGAEEALRRADRPVPLRPRVLQRQLPASLVAQRLRVDPRQASTRASSPRTPSSCTRTPATAHRRDRAARRRASAPTCERFFRRIGLAGRSAAAHGLPGRRRAHRRHRPGSRRSTWETLCLSARRSRAASPGRTDEVTSAGRLDAGRPLEPRPGTPALLRGARGRQRSQRHRPLLGREDRPGRGRRHLPALPRQAATASAVVLRAVEEAVTASGHTFVFLIADDEDWPKELYAQLGFEPIGHTWSFLRTPGARRQGLAPQLAQRRAERLTSVEHAREQVAVALGRGRGRPPS